MMQLSLTSGKLYQQFIASNSVQRDEMLLLKELSDVFNHTVYDVVALGIPVVRLINHT